jgi:hypothetical protein
VGVEMKGKRNRKTQERWNKEKEGIREGKRKQQEKWKGKAINNGGMIIDDSSRRRRGRKQEQ